MAAAPTSSFDDLVLGSGGFQTVTGPARIIQGLRAALGEPLGEGAWAVRVHVKPFVRWIWFGGLLTGFGGLLAALDRRYRVKVKSRVREALGLQGAAV